MYGFSDKLLERVWMMYTNAVSVIQINGNISGPISIGCSMKKWYPLSMVLIVLFFNRLTQCLEETLQGQTRVDVVA
jgi:hypothetical protein